MTKGQEEKEDRHVTADMSDEESSRRTESNCGVCNSASSIEVLNIVLKSTEDKDTSEKNDLQEGHYREYRNETNG